MKKAVIYGRVSTEDKQDYSRQVFELKDYAKKNDFDVVKEFTEKISGTKKDREEFNKMIDYVKANNIHTILVTELSRFGRMGVTTRVAIEELAEQKINVFFKDRNFNSLQSDGNVNSDTMMIIGILSDIAKKELDTLKSRIVSGLRYSASNGGARSGKFKPYGFTSSEDKKLVIEENERKIVQEIFNLYEGGLGCSQIAKYLNSKNIATRYNLVAAEQELKTRSGKKKMGKDFNWSSGTITTILKNRIYAGERIHKGEVFKIEAIITPLQFDKVQKLMRNRNNRPIRTIKNDNYLKGIIFCGVCGEAYYMHKRADGRDNAYKCLSNKYRYEGKIKKECGSPSINIDKLLDAVRAASEVSIQYMAG